jgi:prevent-host-death family protein
MSCVANLLQNMKIVPQRELRNRIGSVLREVEAGERIRITVAGRPVADLVPITGVRRTFVPKDDLVTLLHRFPVDRRFARDLAAVNTTIDEL